MDIYNVSRSLNSAFLISQNQDSFVQYSVDISAQLTLSGGETGTVFLEYADDEAFTTNVIEVARGANGNTGTLSLGLSITQIVSAQVSGMIPYAKYTRLRTANTTGTPTFTYRSGQEAHI